MFYSFIIKIRTPEDIFLPPYTGHFIYALFLDIVNKANPNLAKKLYEPNEVKPFTVSPLIGRFKSHNDSVMLSKEDDFYIRITIMDSSLFSPVISVLLDSSFRNVVIGGHQFDVLKIIVTPQDHRYASFETLDTLWNHASSESRIISLDFLTPTTFKSGDSNSFLPLPEKVFKSIEKKFLIFAHGFMKKDVKDEDMFAKGIRIVRFDNLSTNVIELKQGKQIGFTGRVYYQIKAKDRPIIKYINALAGFAKYSGVGAKTTLGLGQVIRNR